MEWTRCIRIRQEGVFEIDLEERGVRVSALDVRFPKHESKRSDTDEHKYCLQEQIEPRSMSRPCLVSRRGIPMFNASRKRARSIGLQPLDSRLG